MDGDDRQNPMFGWGDSSLSKSQGNIQRSIGRNGTGRTQVCLRRSVELIVTFLEGAARDPKVCNKSQPFLFPETKKDLALQ